MVQKKSVRTAKTGKVKKVLRKGAMKSTKGGQASSPSSSSASPGSTATKFRGGSSGDWDM